MKPICSTLKYFLSVVILWANTVTAQVSGNVFRDLNGNGSREAVSPAEPGEYGVQVRAYDVSNLLIATAITDANGDYSFSAALIPSGTPVRLEFIPAPEDFPSKRIAGNRSNIQFVTGGSTNIDFAVAGKKLFTNTANPFVATTAYTNGDPNSSGLGKAGDRNNLYIFPYDLSSDGGPSRRAKNQYLGAIFGLAWQRESRILLMSAYLKRHSGFGPNGIGAIYQSQISGTGVPSTPTLLVDVSTIGINVGANPRINPLPTAANGPNTDVGVFAEVGKRGIGSMDISSDGRDLYFVNMFEKKVHRINIGNPIKSSFSAADVTGSWNIPDPGLPGTVWHPMAIEVHNGKVYVGGVAAKETTTAHDIADTANMRGVVYEFDPAIGAASFVEVLRFPLTYRRGYINNDYRYEFRNNYWGAWQNNGDISIGGPLRAGLIGSTTGGNATGIYYPQPMLCNIEFDVDGSMIIGIRDRFGDQGGYSNYFETGNVPGETYRTLATGEVLRAGRAGAVWAIENNGSVTNNGVTTTTPGVTGNAPAQSGSFPGQTGQPYGAPFGPGGGYYYYNHSFTTVGVPAPFNAAGTVTSHYVKSNGGLAIFPGYNEVVTTAIDPNGVFYTNGIIRNFNLGANAGNMSGRLDLIAPPSSSSDPATMGKAAALGDLELLIDAQQLEIGNRVWNDADGNGVQDANEYGIAGITVTLTSPGLDGFYGSGDDQVWNTVTDAEGHYYFDETLVNDNRRPAEWLGVSSTQSGILSGFEYRVSINTVQVPLASLTATVSDNNPNDAIDSDGLINGVNVQYTLNPGGPTVATSTGNDYNIDFGFRPVTLPVKAISLSATVLQNDIEVKWNTVNELNVSRFEVERSTDAVNFSKIGTVSSKGAGSFNYATMDVMAGVMPPIVYYRLKIFDTNGNFHYSQVVNVRPGATTDILISPNPFAGAVNIQVNSTRAVKGTISIINSAGAVLYRNKVTWQQGINSVLVNEAAQFPAGVYIVEVQMGDVKHRKKLLKNN